MESSAPPPVTATPPPSRVDEILSHLALDDGTPLPPHLTRQPTATPLSLAEIEASLVDHPFFITPERVEELTTTGAPLPPLLDAFQQLKYSPDENTPLDLARTYKADALFQYQHGKYRIAATLFTEAIKQAEQGEGEESEQDAEFASTLYNNRGVCQFHISNFRSALTDFKRALALRPTYAKAWRKAVECCLRLGRVEEGMEILQAGLAQGMEDQGGEMGKKLKAQERAQKLTATRAVTTTKAKTKEHLVILEKIRFFGIKMSNPDFLGEENEAVVRLSSEGDHTLLWPVLLFYPQHSTSDFIKEVAFDEGLLPHISEILDTTPPAWDRDGDYTSSTVSLHYVDSRAETWVEVADWRTKTLGDVLREERYALPHNGVPAFFILAQNEFCDFFRNERM